MMLVLLIAATVASHARPAPTSPMFEQAKTLIRAQLRDPDSATFRNLRLGNEVLDGRAVCGEVNARNGFGGMVGYRRFYAGRVQAVIDNDDGTFGGFYPAACG